MERQVDKINRQVEFMFAQIYDAEEVAGANNTWKYNRAPEGYKFVLDSIEVSTTKSVDMNDGIVAVFDGHEYTHWNMWPGVESREMLTRCETDSYNIHYIQNLNGWECKEYTIGIRSASATYPFKVVTIVWYYLRKMSWLEKLQYAVMQPRGQRYRKGGPTTVERSES